MGSHHLDTLFVMFVVRANPLIQCLDKLKVGPRNWTSTLAKKDIHPEFFPEAKVLCNGKVVMKVGGSQEEYVVDLWSGNHPFFQGATSTVVVDEGQVNRFKKRFAGLGNLSTIQTVSEKQI